MMAPPKQIFKRRSTCLTSRVTEEVSFLSGLLSGLSLLLLGQQSGTLGLLGDVMFVETVDVLLLQLTVLNDLLDNGLADTTLALEARSSDQTLNLRSLSVLLVIRDLTTNDELADVISLLETEQFADLGGTLGTEALGGDGVGQAFDVGVSLLDDDQVEHGQ